MFPASDEHDKKMQGRLRSHYARHHPGHYHSGSQPGQMPTLVTQVAADQDVAWKCEFCDHGISLKPFTAGANRVARDKMNHKKQHRPRISWKRWRQSDFTDRALATTQTKQKRTTKPAKAFALPGSGTVGRAVSVGSLQMGQACARPCQGMPQRQRQGSCSLSAPCAADPQAEVHQSDPAWSSKMCRTAAL